MPSSNMSTNIKAIKEGFPRHPVIPKHMGLPTDDVIAAVHMKMIANIALVASILGGGVHGLLGITVSTNTYYNITGEQFKLLITQAHYPLHLLTKLVHN